MDGALPRAWPLVDMLRLLATGALGDEDWKRAEGFLGELLRLPDSDDGQLRSSAWRDYVACLAQQDEVAREAAAMAAWARILWRL